MNWQSEYATAPTVDEEINEMSTVVRRHRSPCTVECPDAAVSEVRDAFEDSPSHPPLSAKRDQREVIVGAIWMRKN